MNPSRDNQTGHTGRRNPFAVLAVAYLLLPVLVFLLTWVRPWIGVPMALLVGAGVILFWCTNVAGGLRPKLSGRNWMFVLALAFLWTLLSGAGGFVPQVSDYEKHNLVFHDLLGQTWPVKYASDAGTNYLCYGLGYYLVPVFVARMIGEASLPVLTFLWMMAGLVIFFYWVATFSGSSKKTLGIVLLFATTETLWHMFLHILHQPAWAGRGYQIDASLTRLGIGPDYSDAFVSLQYRPQHVLSAWLGAALFYEMFWVWRNPRGSALVWAACWFWSPLMSLGLLLVPLMALKRWRWQDIFEPVNGVGTLLLGLLGIYFQGHVSLTENGPIWKFSNGGEWLVLYPVFLLFQLSPVLLLYLVDRRYNLLGDLRPLFLGSAALLLLLPLYKIGYYGDLRLQASTPALLFIALAASRCFQSSAFSLKRPLFVLLVASQLVGAAYPFAKWWWQNLPAEQEDFSYAATVRTTGFQNLSEFRRPGYDYASQYLGHTNRLAVRWLLR